MVARTAIIPASDPSLLSYALTPEAHDLRDHTGVPNAGGGGENLSQTLVIGNTTGPNDISVDPGQKVTGAGALALGGYGTFGGYGRFGTLAEPAAAGDFGAGLTGAAARFAFIQAAALWTFYDSAGAAKFTLDHNVALATAASEVIAAINEVRSLAIAAGGTGGENLAQTLAIGNATGPNSIAVASGQQVSGGRANFGTVALAVADGDLAAGIAAAARLFYQQSSNTFQLHDGSNAAVTMGGAGYGRFGTLAEPVAAGDIGSGLTGAAARWWYDQSAGLWSFHDASGAVKYTLDNTVALATTAQEIIAAINEVKTGLTAINTEMIVLDRDATPSLPILGIGGTLYSVTIPAGTLDVVGKQLCIDLAFAGAQSVAAPDYNEMDVNGVAKIWPDVTGARPNMRLGVRILVSRRDATNVYIDVRALHIDEAAPGVPPANAVSHHNSDVVAVADLDLNPVAITFSTIAAPAGAWTWYRQSQIAYVIAA